MPSQKHWTNIQEPHRQNQFVFSWSVHQCGLPLHIAKAEAKAEAHLWLGCRSLRLMVNATWPCCYQFWCRRTIEGAFYPLTPLSIYICIYTHNIPWVSELHVKVLIELTKQIVINTKRLAHDVVRRHWNVIHCPETAPKTLHRPVCTLCIARRDTYLARHASPTTYIFHTHHHTLRWWKHTYIYNVHNINREYIRAIDSWKSASDYFIALLSLLDDYAIWW